MNSVTCVSNDLLRALKKRTYLFTSWPWRAFAYAITGVPGAMIAGGAAAIVALPWLAAVGMVFDGRWPPLPLAFLMVLVAGLAVVCGPLLALPMAAIERRRMAIVDDRPLGSPHRNAGGDPVRWVGIRFTESATWRAVAHLGLLGTIVPMAYAMIGLLVAVAIAMVTSPFLINDGILPIAVGNAQLTAVKDAIPYAIGGVLALAATPYLVGLLVAGQAAVTRALLGGRDSDIREVARSRERLADAYEAERRRIERDLHDGAQHRLTSLTLQIGVARLDVPADSPAAEPLAKAHDQAKELMGVLRELIHGIRPQTLTELGLAGAVRELAADATLPVGVQVVRGWDGRLPERVETTAYFAAAEALGNVARHAAATRADVTFERAGRLLVMEVRDDGRGGADPATGTGLTGLADRVAAVGGRLLLSSPAGGPTLVRVELPCDR
ncbi:MAG: sensor histidine kinase [Hamadaea sp.]|nr:sensor histidine kinase [Hamadaea sp.]